MSKKNRLSKKVLQDDREAYAALLAITDYNPSNPAFKLSNVTASHTAMETKQTIEVQSKAAADAASDGAAEGEHDFHDQMIGVKTQVKAQYGENSNEYASLGMKKKNEYKAGRRTASKNNGETT